MSNKSPTNPPQDAETLREKIVEIFVEIADQLHRHKAAPRSEFHKDLDVQAVNNIMQLIEAYTEAQRVSARDEALLEAGWIRCDYCSEVKLSCSHTYSADGKVTGHICKECKEKQREQ